MYTSFVLKECTSYMVSKPLCSVQLVLTCPEEKSQKSLLPESFPDI